MLDVFTLFSAIKLIRYANNFRSHLFACVFCVSRENFRNVLAAAVGGWITKIMSWSCCGTTHFMTKRLLIRVVIICKSNMRQHIEGWVHCEETFVLSRISTFLTDVYWKRRGFIITPQKTIPHEIEKRKWKRACSLNNKKHLESRIPCCV